MAFLRTFLRYLSLFLGIVVFCAILMGGMLWASWTVAGHEPTIASRWISVFLRQEVHIGHIDLRWQGLSPQLRLSSVRVMDLQTGRQALRLKEIDLSVALYRSLVEGRWILGQLTMMGGQLTVERKPEGCIRIHGLQSLGEPCSRLPPSSEWLLKLDGLRLVNLEVRWIDPSLEKKPLVLTVERFHLSNDDNVHRIEGIALLPERFGRKVAIKAKFTGNKIWSPNSHGTLYLKGEGLQLAHWQSHHRFLYGLHFTQGSSHLELGLRWKKAVLQQVITKFDGKNLRIAGETPAVGAPDTVSFQQLAGTAHYQRLAKGWSLKIPHLSVVRDDKSWPATALQVKMEEEPVPKLEGQFEFLRLQDIVPLYQISDRVDSKLRLLLTQIQPVGELRDIKVVLPLGKGQAGDWKFSATVGKFGMQPWQHWPGGQGLSFELQLADRGGVLHLNSHHVQLVSNDVEKPVALDTLGGRVTWLQRGGGWQIHADDMQLHNRDLVLAGSLRLNKEPRAKTPHLDLSLLIKEMDLTALSRYLPSRSMKPGLVGWLNQAFSNGRIRAGNLLFQGPLDYFSSPSKSGQFTVNLDIREATLNYASGWPALRQVNAHLHSDGQYMTVKVAKGRMFNTQVIDATVQLVDLGAAIIPLKVVGQAQGDAKNIRHFIQQSPLKERYGELLAGMEASGKTHLNLELSLILGEHNEWPKVDGELIFADVHLHQRDNPFLKFTAIKGSLYFSQAGLKSENLSAQLLGQPVELNLRSLPNQMGEGAVQLSVSGRVESLWLAEKWFPSLSSWLQGAADFVMQMTFQKAQADGGKIATVQLRSDLKGIEVALPPPLAKPASQARSLLWEIKGVGQDKKQVTTAYGDDLHGVFEVKGSGKSLRLLRGEVRTGGDSARLPEQGIWLVGTLPNLSIGAWQNAIAMVTPADFSKQALFNDIALQVDQLDLLRWHFSDVTIKANRISSHWQVQITAPDLKGSITIPAVSSKGLWVIDLDRLRLNSRSSGGELQLADPRTWPAIDLVCRQCWYQGHDLGVIKVHANTYVDGLYLKKLEIVSPILELKASGDWAVHGKNQWSHIDIKIHSSDLGRLLTDLGYQASIAGGGTEAEIIIGWPGSPAMFSLKRLSGSVQLTVGKGRLLNVEPGAGRLFGLLSVLALPRRLALDFSDIFGEGFAFDHIKGIFSIRQGNAYSNEWVMEGPTARVRASGRIGLATQDYDQIIAVTPHIFSSLPLAGAVAGGPVGLGVGTALMLADKILGSQVGQLLTYYYRVSGPWTNLVATRVK